MTTVITIMKASEHGFADGDHLVLDGHEYSATEILGVVADLEIAQTELDAMTCRYRQLATAAQHHIANGGSASVLQEALNATGSPMTDMLQSLLKDAARYSIICEHVAPLELHAFFKRAGKAAPWHDLLKEQSINSKLDELCDEAIQRNQP